MICKPLIISELRTVFDAGIVPVEGEENRDSTEEVEETEDLVKNVRNKHEWINAFESSSLEPV